MAITRVNSSSISAAGSTATAYSVALGVGCNVGDLLIVTANSNGTHVALGMSVQETTTFQSFTSIWETDQGGASTRWLQTFYLVTTTAMISSDSIQLTPYALNTASTFTVDIFRGASGSIIDSTDFAGPSGASAAAPALSVTPAAGSLVLSLTSVSSGTATQPSPFLLGSQNTSGPTTSTAYVLSADGSSTYGGTWTWGTANTSALQTVAFRAAALVAPAALRAAPGQTWRRHFRHRQFVPAGSVSGPFQFTQPLNATLSFTGSSNVLVGKLIAATAGFTGALTRKTATVRNATVGFTGSAAFRTGKALASTLSFTSSQTRSVAKAIAATLGFTSSQTRAIKTNLSAATVSFTGAVTKRTGKALNATVSFTGSHSTAVVHLFTQALNATLSFTGSQTRSVGTHLAGTVSFTGSQTRRVGKGLSATASFTSSQARAIRTNLAGTVSFTGAVTKRTAKNLGTATVSFTGSLTTAAVHFFTQALNATLSFTGSQTRSVGKTLAATVSFTGSQTRRVSKGLSATASFTSSQTRAIKTNLAGTVSFTSSQTRRTVKSLGTATVSFTGSIATQAAHFFTQALNATLSFTGSLTRQRIFFKALSASLSFTGSHTKQTGKLLVAGLSFTGSQTKRIAKTISATLGLTGLVNLLVSAIPSRGTASAAQMSVPESTPGSGTAPTSEAGNTTGPTSSAP